VEGLERLGEVGGSQMEVLAEAEEEAVVVPSQEEAEGVEKTTL
jgi:hypothetical protein